jgi:hypothetical protein
MLKFDQSWITSADSTGRLSFQKQKIKKKQYQLPGSSDQMTCIKFKQRQDMRKWPTVYLYINIQ